MSENFLTQVWGLFFVGLISKEVEILLSSKNIKYYEYLGCEIPRYYNKLEDGTPLRWMYYKDYLKQQ